MRTTTPDPLATISTGTPLTGTTTAVATMMRTGNIPGLSVAVVDRDRIRLAAGYGLADRARDTPSTAATAYLWFSMTKIVTATAALGLADDGRLDLDAPAAEYFSGFRPRGVEQPTVRQLLTHTAGLGNPLPLRWTHRADAEPPDPHVLLGRLLTRRHAFTHPAGKIARYSNVGYLAVGEIIGTAAGMPFTDDVHAVRPLVMDHTGFRYRADTDRATGYVRAPRIADPLLRRLLPAGIAGDHNGPFLALNPFYVDGPAYGGLIGDVLDAGRFLRMHLNDGELDGHRVLTPQTARGMRSIDHHGKPFDHGIGWFRSTTNDTGDWVEHFGAGAGFWNVLRLYPDRGIGPAAVRPVLRAGLHHRVPLQIRPATDAAGGRRRPRRPAGQHLAPRTGRPPTPSTGGSRRCRRTPHGKTTCCSTSTSTVTTEPVWVRCTKPGGERWSRTC